MQIFAMTSQQFLVLVVVVGFVWVMSMVFRDSGAVERERDEAGFDLIAKFSNWLG